MTEHEHEFMVDDHTQVFFTNESRVTFWNAKTDEEIFYRSDRPRGYSRGVQPCDGTLGETRRGRSCTRGVEVI